MPVAYAHQNTMTRGRMEGNLYLRTVSDRCHGIFILCLPRSRIGLFTRRRNKHVGSRCRSRIQSGSAMARNLTLPVLRDLGFETEMSPRGEKNWGSSILVLEYPRSKVTSSKREPEVRFVRSTGQTLPCAGFPDPRELFKPG